jgi:hypothetical protein
VSPTGVDDWEEDVLGVDTLDDGDSIHISFSPKERAKLWDLRIVDSDGDATVWGKLRLDEISRVTLRYDKNGTPTADLE